MLDQMTNEEELRTVGERIRTEVLHAKGIEGPITELQPFTDHEYKAACEHLGTDILSRELLEKNLQELRQSYGRFKSLFREDYDYGLAVFPTTDMGHELTPADIENNRYLHLLFIDKKNGVTSNYSMNKGRFFDLLPPSVQKLCRFSVRYTDASTLVNARDFSAFYNSYIGAFNNLRQYFGLEKIDIPLYSEAA